MSQSLLFATIIVFIYMTGFYFLAQIKKNAGLVDIGWGLGFIVVALSTFILNRDNFYASFVQSVVLILVSLWGLRLAIHVYFRNRNKPEDFRYRAWRKGWGKLYPIRSFFQIFMLQGLFMLVLSLPIIALNTSTGPYWKSLMVCGLLIWLLGFIFETVGDWQLKTFIKNNANKGHIITSGLWKYTRHPNYFGEVTLWWGIFLICYSATGIWWLVVSPVLITVLILKVSGIPMLEKKYLGNSEFESYKKRTSAFLPWFPKK